ncbi:MAG TPA: methylenetetrahydrofolate reductase [NAD(P)H] [Caulobacteraceae bacterium]|nr:methylenetetrahydrofolate reductase [NAD(P)H] [Caulobacteraceae bacterium]
MTAAVAKIESALGPVARAGERLARRKVRPLGISFEFSPPKSPAMEETLWACIGRLAPLEPSFVSVTYGAGGSTRERTHRTVRRIQEETSLKAAAHLTCVEASRSDVEQVVRGYWEAGIRHIVALRGDPPGSIGGRYEPRADGYRNATELTAGIARIAPFEISVSLYPQKHPESPSLEHDIDVLKAKVDAGATRAISQFFFDIDAFLRFTDQVRKAGVGIPILPGIMPVSNFKGLQSMAGKSGIPLPDWLGALFEGLDDDPATRQLIACAVAAEMCARLAEEGYGDIHFYTMNRAELTYAICRVLGAREALQ